MTATATRTPRREPIGVLDTIRYDADASNPWAEVYRADSDSTEGLRYKVTFLPRTARWSCDCRGASQGHVCKHQRRSQRKRRVRYYAALWAGQPDRVLLAHRDHYAARVAEGTVDDDALAALDFLALTLGEDIAA